MTQPLTPREKVAQIIKEKVSGPHFTDPSLLDAMEQDRLIAASDILTALASGSGDHAELARLCSEAKAATTMWHADKALRAIEQICSPDYLLSLLAEIAALRAERDAKDLEIGRVIFRATEAERKLAEAVGLLRLFQAYAQSGQHFVYPLGSLQQLDTFLSKEAERG